MYSKVKKLRFRRSASPCPSRSPSQRTVFPRSLPPPLLHGQDLHHPHKDVDKVQLQRDALVDRVLGQQPPLGEARMVQHLLHVVQREAAEDGQAAVQPDVLGPHEGAGGGGGDDHGRETRERDDGHAREQRAAEVEVLLLLGGGADEGDGAHHAGCVEASAGEDGRVHEEEGGEEGGLAEVEGGPEAVFLDVAGRVGLASSSLGGRGREEVGVDVLVRMRRASSVHGSQAAYEAYAQDEPWVRGHESVAPSVHVQGARGHADDADAETSVHECVVQVAALEVGHAAVLARLAVEDEVDAEQGGAEDAGAVDEALAEIALGHGIVGSLLIGAAEGGAEAGDIVGGGERGCLWGEEVGALVERRDVERAGEDGLRLLGGSLAKGCGDGEGPPEEEGHGCVRCRVCRCRSGELLMDVNEDSKVMTCM